jgi:protoheme IX farnesyltransferase
VIGWAAVTGSISLEPLLLLLLVFVWTPPHFWALALLRADDYARAGVPMLPVVAGAQATRRQILIYSLLLIPVGAAPWFLGSAGIGYGVTSLIGGALMVALAGRMMVYAGSERANTAARQMFGCSIVYLFVLFSARLIDGLVMRAAG